MHTSSTVTVLLDKVQEMKAAAAGEAERRGVPTEKKSAKQEARLVLAVHSGTPPMYATLETLLRQLDDYSVFVLEEEFILTLHPMSAEALAGRDPDGARRKHLERWRDGIKFQSFAVEVYEAQWGGQRKLSLFVWRVPLTNRDSPWALTLQAQAIAEAQKQIPVIHRKYARQEFTQKYSRITGLRPAMLESMYTLLTSDTQAPTNG